VKAERFAFQLLQRFFFLFCRVKAALERLEVPSSSSEDSSSSSSGKLNFRYGTGERLDCCSFPVVLAIVVASSSVALSNMDTLEALET
jgi:hypothetical protein